MGNDYVLAWLKSVDPTATHHDYNKKDTQREAKRVKLSDEAHYHRLLTPAHSEAHDVDLDDLQDINIDGMGSPSKRLRQEEDPFVTEEALNETPRASQSRDWRTRDNLGSQRASSPVHSLTSESSRASSSVTHNSSPTKQYRNAELQDTGFRLASFTVHQDRQPVSLRALRRQLTNISYGHELIPAIMREQLDNVDLPNSAFFDAGNTSEESQWRYPPIELVHEILNRAALCLDEHEGESSWNVDVHVPLLAWVFRSKNHSRLIDYRYCTSAQVISYFKPKNAPSKMVDFCIMIRPDDDGPEQDAIDSLCRDKPGLTINHTDWGNLCKNPIAISIETKRQGEQWDKAILQMGAWHSSQWRSICWRRPQPPSSIEFMAGIIIQGHDWLFVATTYGNKGTTLYHSVRIGDTETELGIYKLVISLQCLQRWAEEVYWPAFKADVLGMET